MKIDPFHPLPPSSSLIASICRCATPTEHAQRAESRSREDAHYQEQSHAETIRRLEADRASRTPDPDRYVVERVQRVGEHLVLQVRYPNCTKCEYEGLKTMVFLHVGEAEALRWRRIDPHFRGATKITTEAPTPAARFPGNEVGWADAVAYAERKQ